MGAFDGPALDRIGLKLAALELPPLGNGVRSCAVVTRTLVFVGPASEVGGRSDAVPRAFDKRSGSLVGAIDLPAPGRGCPMTYEAAGKQYIALTIGSEEVRPRLIALALP